MSFEEIIEYSDCGDHGGGVFGSTHRLEYALASFHTSLSCSAYATMPKSEESAGN